MVGPRKAWSHPTTLTLTNPSNAPLPSAQCSAENHTLAQYSRYPAEKSFQVYTCVHLKLRCRGPYTSGVAGATPQYRFPEVGEPFVAHECVFSPKGWDNIAPGKRSDARGPQALGFFQAESLTQAVSGFQPAWTLHCKPRALPGARFSQPFGLKTAPQLAGSRT
jgi:hypothetical protein